MSGTNCPSIIHETTHCIVRQARVMVSALVAGILLIAALCYAVSIRSVLFRHSRHK